MVHPHHPQAPTHHVRAASLIAGLVAVLLVLAGCAQPTSGNGTPASTSPSPQADTFPKTVDVDGTPVELAAKPTSIVILGPSLTETVYGVGAGSQVKAVDKLSTTPSDAPVTDLDAYTPSVEAIAAQKPDLVLTSGDADGKLAAGLGKLKIPVAVLTAPSDVDGALKQFATVGALTGNTAAGEKLAVDTRATIDAAVASVGQQGEKHDLQYYWELEPTFYSVTSKTFIGSVLGEFGLTSIADKAPDTAGGYPQLNAEFIVDADPDLIFLADAECCQQSATTVAKRPGWDVIRAVKDTDGVVAVNADMASRWGPRIGELATTVAASVQKLQG